MTGIVERGIDDEGMRRIGYLTVILIALYLVRILFRFLAGVRLFPPQFDCNYNGYLL